MRRVAPLLAIVLLAGCGGHGGSSDVAVGKGKGRGVVMITWPTRAGRLIPKAANSIVVTLTQGTTVAATKTIPRPSDGTTTTTTTFTGLAYGTYTVGLAAFPTADASGVAQGRGTGSMVVTEDTPGTATVSLVSTVTTLSLVSTTNSAATSADLAANVAGSTGTNPTLTLSLSAKDAQGQLVLLDVSDLSATDNRLSFTSDNSRVATVVGNTTAASLDLNKNLSATVTGLVGGSTNIVASFKVADSGATVTSAPFVVNVVDPRLAGSFARSHGDSGGTGQSSTAIAASGGSIARTLTVSAGFPVSAIVTDANGNVYAGAGSTVKAFSPTGTTLWTQTVDGSVTSLALTNTRIYVGAQKLSALDNATGALAFSYTTASATANGFNDINVLSDGTIITTANTNPTTTEVSAVSPTTHLAVWKSSLGFRTQNAPVITSDDVVVVSAGTQIVGLSGASGDQVFNRFANAGETFTAPAATGTSIFYVSRRLTGNNTATDVETTLFSDGTVTSTTLAFAGTVDATPTYSGIGYSTASNRIVLSGTATQTAPTGTLAGVSNANPASPVWTNSSVSLRAQQGASFISNGRGYLVTTSNTVVAFDSNTGALDAGFTPVSVSNPTSMSPVVSSDGTVYVALTTGAFVAIR